MISEKAIKLAEEQGWQNPERFYNHGYEEMTILDSDFWQILGRGLGNKDEMRCDSPKCDTVQCEYAGYKDPKRMRDSFLELLWYGVDITNFGMTYWLTPNHDQTPHPHPPPCLLELLPISFSMEHCRNTGTWVVSHRGVTYCQTAVVCGNVGSRTGIIMKKKIGSFGEIDGIPYMAVGNNELENQPPVGMSRIVKRNTWSSMAQTKTVMSQRFLVL